SASPPKPPSKKRSSGARSRGRRNELDLRSLLVETVVLNPPEVIAAGGVGFKLVGSEKSNRIAFSPSRYIRLHVIRNTWVRVSSAPEDAEANAAKGADADDVDLPMSSSSMQSQRSASAGVDAENALPPDAELITGPIPAALWPNSFADASAI